MLKKILATALAAAMIFGLANVAFAATFSDVTGNKNEAAINRLAAVGIFGGYPDGTFKPGNPITRAEFSKIVVVALGLGDTADMMAAVPTGFSDVPVDHWANGFISIAASQGIVKGDPAGTFRPDANVTYAEAVTMVMRALGYEPVCKNGVWPAAYLTRATSIGIIGSMTFVASAPATRGDVATLLSNSLAEPWLVETEWDFNGNPVKFAPDANKTFLAAMGAERYTGWVVDSPELFDNEGDTITLDLDGVSDVLQPSADDDEVTLDLADDTAVAGLLGHKVTAWLNDDDEVFFVEDKTAAADVRPVDDIKSDGTTLVIDDEEYTAADYADVLAFFNYGADNADNIVLGSDLGVLADDDVITAIFDGEQMIALVALDYEYGVVDSVSTTYNRISFKNGGSVRFEDSDDEYEVVWSGAAESLSDLEEDDVVQYIVGDDELKAIANVERNVVTGEYTRILTGTNAGVYVGGTKYTEALGYNVPDLLGKEVVICLNQFGKVQYMYQAEEDTVEYIAVVVAVDDDDRPLGDPVAVVQLFTAEGDTIELEATDDFTYDTANSWIEWDGADGNTTVGDDKTERMLPGDIVEYVIDEDGLLSEVTVRASLSDASDANDSEAAVVDDEDEELVLNNRAYALTANTVIFDMTDFVEDTDPEGTEYAWTVQAGVDDDDLDVLDLDDLFSNANIQAQVYQDQGRVVAIGLFWGDSTQDANLYGYVVDRYATKSGRGIVVLADGVEEEFLFADTVTVDTDGDGTAGEADEDVDGDGVLDTVNEDLDGDGRLDVDEDANDNGLLDAGEDLDGDTRLDVDEDVDGDGNLDVDEDTDSDGHLDVDEVPTSIVEEMVVVYDLTAGEISDIATADELTPEEFDAQATELRVTDIDGDVIEVTGYDADGDEEKVDYFTINSESLLFDETDGYVSIELEDLAIGSLVRIYLNATNANVIDVLVVTE